MQERGYTIEQIAAFLKERDVVIPVTTLNIYLRRTNAHTPDKKAAARSMRRKGHRQKTTETSEPSSVNTTAEPATHHDDDQRHGTFTPAPDTPDI